MIIVNAEKAFELIFNLFQHKPWLTTSGPMTEADYHAEGEAVAFLLSLEQEQSFENCSPAAARVATALLLDFMVKLQGPFSQHCWQVSPNLALWQQALAIVSAEIRGSHSPLANMH